MADVNSKSTAEGLFKEVYGDLQDRTPRRDYFCKEIKGGKGSKTGGTYKRPQVLTSEQGFTKAAPNATAYALRSPSAGSTKFASYDPYNFSLRVAFATEAIERSGEGKEVFASITKRQTANAIKTAYNQMEQDFIYGRNDIGVISVVTSNVLTISQATFAPGLWWGSEGMSVWIYSSDLSVLRGIAKVESYNIDRGTRTVTMEAASMPAGVIATDRMYTSVYSDQMYSIYSMATNTSGTIFGISSTDYNLWRPAAATAITTALDYDTLFSAVNKSYNRGLGDDTDEIEIFTSTQTWTNLNQDAAAIRTSDYSYKGNEFENGHEKLKFYTNAGICSIISHKYIKESQAFILPKVSQAFEKLGAVTTPKFGLKGSGDKIEYLRQMENNEGYESRIYWNASLATDLMSQLGIVTGIVNR